MTDHIASCSRLRIAALLAFGLLAMAPLSSARAALNCSTATASGLAEPAPKAAANPKAFRIYWHVGTQIEQIADAPARPDAMADLKRARASADGYYVMGALSGNLGYWPNRPARCLANAKRIGDGDSLTLGGEEHQFDGGGAALKQQCEAEIGKALAPAGKTLTGPEIAAVQSTAFQTAAHVLDLAGESRRGKVIMAPVLLRQEDFAYDAASGRLSMTALPSAYCSLAKAGIVPDSLLIYQEPRVRNMLRIPRDAGSAPSNADFLPRNTAAFGLVDKAFGAAHVPLAGISPNLRTWTPQFRRLVAAYRSNPHIEGINFEASTKLLLDDPGRIGRIAAGIAYILDNSNYDITLLIPAYWRPEDVATSAGIDGLTLRTREFVETLDRELRAAAGSPQGRSPLCDGRIALIPASYGNPVHPATLPARRNGGWAGTVTGQIGLLADMRNELCGT